MVQSEVPDIHGEIETPALITAVGTRFDFFMIQEWSQCIHAIVTFGFKIVRIEVGRLYVQVIHSLP